MADISVDYGKMSVNALDLRLNVDEGGLKNVFYDFENGKSRK